MIMKDYYGILEVNEKASPEIIEKAYKTLVKKYHPDLYSSVEKKQAEIKLKDINEAYNILSDSFLRSQYDLELQRERNRIHINENVSRTNTENDQNRTTQKRNEKTSRNQRKKTKTEFVKNKNNVGTIFGLADLIRDLWSNRPEKKERRKMNQTDWLAIGLTIVSLLIIGVILWLIPFTNGWMRQLLFENPIFNFIGGLFS